ncbi:MAG: CBS domain-containing protein [Alphaproteobacteria bacterium]|nr:CBS domain-containing protein [Alphaproteobacteria bacterium]
MKAIDIMTTNVITVSPETSVYDAAQLLLRHRITSLPVLNAEKRLVGLISESDLMRRNETKCEKRCPWWSAVFASDLRLASEFLRTHGRLVSDVMSSAVTTAHARMSLRELAELMERHVIKRLPVVDGDRLVGIVSRRDLLRALLALEPIEQPAAEIDDRAIRQRLLAELGKRHWAGSIVANAVVDGGIVHLWGEAGTNREVDACRALAGTIDGVRGVSSHMVVSKSAA